MEDNDVASPARAWQELLSRLTERAAYRFITAEYEGKIARRSGLPYLNHINEGVFLIYRRFGFQCDLIDAYCLHPIFQSDRSLTRLVADTKNSFLSKCPSRILIFAMEYRRVANGYISTMKVKQPDLITLSPLEEVNKLLVADKIQNKKDFMKYMNYDNGKVSYRRVCQRYIAYFDSWLTCLGISPEIYASACLDLECAFPVS